MTTNPPHRKVDNQVTAHRVDHLVQAGTIAGDVHLHSTPAQAVVPRQMPLANRWFTGRSGELNALTAAVDAGHHVAAVGTGGVGKTSIVLHWAHLNVDRFPDGQLFVNLRGQHVADGLRALLSGLDSDHSTLPASFEAQLGRYRSLLAGLRVLIVLDNATDSTQVTPLLPGSGPNTMLITSRDRLDGLHSTTGVHRMVVATMARSDAVNLIMHRIGAARVRRETTALAELIGYCGGLPLALAVVAGRLATRTSFPLAAVAAELRDASTRIEALDTGEQGATLTAVLSSSYDSLSSDAREVLELIGLTALPDFGIAALTALVDATPGEVRARMRELERASLADEHLPGRWQVHDLVRLHAANQARDAGESAARLVEHYLHTAFSGDHELDRNRLPLRTNPPIPGSHPLVFNDYEAALAWFDLEHQCLIATQQMANEHGWHAHVWQLSWAMHSYRWRRARIHDQAAGWQLALTAAEKLGDARWTAIAHRLLGAANARTGNLEDAFRHLVQALTMFTEQENPAGRGDAHRALARAHERIGNYGQALEQAEAALDLYRETRQRHWEADALDLVCWYEAKLERFNDARRHGTEALELYRRLEDHDGEATALDSLGYIAHRSGRQTDAVEHYEQALVLLRNRNSYHEANTLDRLAELHSERGHVVDARAVWERALVLFRAQHLVGEADRVQRRLDSLGGT
ncbi:tetratricopeptide repeat protein [Umezawaea sp. Da 62-37]|uniref:tetratricopeptide repeat protein n=1 Tax=Umezawaea sp. Da 62-37 TaxID=3075927 RepID=UPI0028F72145|nr:tetratricopeptide repeat protein [Umezawaea sp. Da 62-37]WNV85341.1 tetratricopeptide repeat protein [Umezawaea sp. Da 62-37]